MLYTIPGPTGFSRWKRLLPAAGLAARHLPSTCPARPGWHGSWGLELHAVGVQGREHIRNTVTRGAPCLCRSRDGSHLSGSLGTLCPS